MEFNPENIANIDKDPLMRESDRGCVLICAADIENLLTQILEDYVDKIGQLSNKDKKSLFDYTGPLGTFSSKILLSRSIGLVGSELYSDIKAIRVLRNKAAHSNSDFSLSDNDNSTLVEAMNYNDDRVKDIKRYSLKLSDDSKDPLDKAMNNETIAKGFGFVSHSKSRFVLIVKNIEIELTKAMLSGKIIADNVLSLQSNLMEALEQSFSEDNESNKQNG